MMGMGFGLGGLVFMVFLWVGLIALAIWGVSVIFPRQRRPMDVTDPNLSAREIVDRRYARGEITAEQHELMKRKIEEGRRL